MLVRVLIAAQDPVFRRRLGDMLAGEDVEVRAASFLPSPGDLSKLGEAHPCELVVVDRAFLGEPPSPGVSALRDLAERPEVVVVQEKDCAVERSELLIAGARDVIPRLLPESLMQPVLSEHLRRVRRSAERRLDRRLQRPRAQLPDPATASPTMRRILEKAYRVSDASSSILLLGESGVGKEWLARSIHAAGRRGSRSFVPVHCGALPQSLIESELFGHEKGSFTGATRLHRGYFELAHGGTIFLDEVGDIPLGLQTKLLRVLQDRQVRRIGSEASLSVDVRVIAATNKDLRRARAEGSFRDDLWFRLAVVEVEVPPLRERAEDIPGMVEQFLAQYARAFGRAVPELHPEAARALLQYPWPGNVRELMNALERAVLLCPGTEILQEHLALDLQAISGAAPEAPSPPTATRGSTAALAEALALAAAGRPAPSLEEVRRRAVEGVERDYLGGLLRITRGSVQETAKRAGIPVRTLFDLLRRHGLDKDQFKEPSAQGREGRSRSPRPADPEGDAGDS